VPVTHYELKGLMPKTFSKKEAISHGFNMTKKYFGVIFSILVVYGAFELASSQLHSRAGQDQLNRSDLYSIYKQDVSKNLYQGLIDSGYVSKYGRVQDKLKNIKNSSELSLPVAFEADREKIYLFLESYMYRLPFSKLVYYVLSLLFWAIYMLMQIGLIKITLMLSRDERPEIPMLYSNSSLLVTYILASLCYGLSIVGGVILLIVPGIIFAVALGMYPYFIVDKEMGPLESLKASRALTRGSRWQLFVFGFVIGLLNIAGALCLLVGLLWTIPTSSIAMAYVYDQLSKKSESSA
jgi:hypothetical protein